MSNKKRSSVVLAKKPSIVATQLALALMAPLAYGQADRVERVEVTGTRLPQISTEGTSPVTVMDAQEIRVDARVKTEDLLNTLPQVFASQSSYFANGASGTAQVNLRGIGAARNLVLVNGRRLPAGSPTSYPADLNQVPAPLIQRVELLTGGASAVYGSDAITGVVNFIMNDKFEGLQIDIGRGWNMHEQQNPQGVSDVVAARSVTNPREFKVPGDVGWGGRISNFSLLMGKNFADNKGNATAFFQYKKEDQVSAGDYDFSACALNPGTTFTCGGSSTNATGRFLLEDGRSRTVASSTGTTRAFSAATDQFNFSPYNYFRRPSEQYGFSAFAHLDVHPKVRAYTELGFHENYTQAQIAPSGLFFGSVTSTIFFENPLLSSDWKSQIATSKTAAGTGAFAATGNTTSMIIGRRNVEGGGRVDDIHLTSMRAVMGAKGEAASHVNYDAFLQTGKVFYQDRYLNDFSKIRIGRALDVVTSPTTGAPVCRSTLANSAGVIEDANCVPWNIWNSGGVSQASLDYLQTPGLQNGTTRLHGIGANLQFDLGGYGVKMPGARDGVGLVVGVERRKEELVLQTDVQFDTFDLAGQGGPTKSLRGKLDVDEFFGEARLPIVQRQPFADLLQISASYRHSDYSTDKKTDTYGFGGEWAPVRAYRLRGTYQRAIRHANIIELFQAQGLNLFSLTQDPCGASPTATAAQCANTGVTAAQYGSALLTNPAGQYNYLQGGNPNLEPETATTYTVGLVMNPVRSVNATLDWWNIKIEDAIGNAPANTLLAQCLTAAQFCGQIQRDPATGALWLGSGRVVSTNLNLGGYEVSGLDIAVNWTTRMGAMGGFGINFNGSYLQKWEFEPIKNVSKFDCVGFFGFNCGAPNPKWRHKVRASWATPWNVDLALTWRHIDKVRNEGFSGDPDLNTPVSPTDAELAARDYFDVAAAWTINKTFSLRAAVNNVLDKDPPVVSNSAGSLPQVNQNVYPAVYDVLGRQFLLNLTMKF